MTEKLYDISIQSPLTDEKRDIISRFITEHAHLFPMQVSHSWNDGQLPILRLMTKPVTWEAHFHGQKVEVFGSGPRWAAVLFTKKRRAEVRERIEYVLHHAGMNDMASA